MMPYIFAICISYRPFSFILLSSIWTEREYDISIFTKWTFIVVLGEMIENTTFSYKSDSSLLVFMFSPNSFYSGLSCTILIFLFSHTLLKNYIYSGKRGRDNKRQKKAMQRPFLSCPSEVFSHTLQVLIIRKYFQQWWQCFFLCRNGNDHCRERKLCSTSQLHWVSCRGFSCCQLKRQILPAPTPPSNKDSNCKIAGPVHVTATVHRY